MTLSVSIFLELFSCYRDLCIYLCKINRSASKHSFISNWILLCITQHNWMGDFYSNVSLYIYSCLVMFIWTVYQRGTKGGGGLHNHQIRLRGVSAAAAIFPQKNYITEKSRIIIIKTKRATLIHQLLAGTWKYNPTSNTLMMPSTMDYMIKIYRWRKYVRIWMVMRLLFM